MQDHIKANNKKNQIPPLGGDIKNISHWSRLDSIQFRSERAVDSSPGIKSEAQAVAGALSSSVVRLVDGFHNL